MIHLRWTSKTEIEGPFTIVDGDIQYGDEWTTIPLEITYPTLFGTRTEQVMGSVGRSKKLTMILEFTVTDEVDAVHRMHFHGVARECNSQ